MKTDTNYQSILMKRVKELPKQVLKISINGKFSQYLKRGEVRLINDIATHGIVTVELVLITRYEYNLNFLNN